MTDESDWTGGSARLDTMFWNAQTTGTGPGITSQETRESAINDGLDSEFAGTAQAVTNIATVSNRRDVDPELSTASRGSRIVVDRDKYASRNSSNLRSPKRKPRRLSTVNVLPGIDSEGNPNSGQHAQDYVELKSFPTRSTTLRTGV